MAPSIQRLRDDFRSSPPGTGIRLVAIFGSRARGDAQATSDWDVGVLADVDADLEDLRLRLHISLASERVDLVDLGRAGGQLRFRAARDGVPVFSSAPDEWPRFWMDAVSFWCDAGPVLRRAYAGVLEELGP